MKKGIVKWFNNEWGIGFIENNEDDSIFVHYMSITDNKKTLSTGDKVEFTLDNSIRGLEAKKVSVIKEGVSKSNSNRAIVNILVTTEDLESGFRHVELYPHSFDTVEEAEYELKKEGFKKVSYTNKYIQEEENLVIVAELKCTLL